MDCKRSSHVAYLDHRCLSHTGFSNKNGVVLCPSAENANDPTNFVITTNDRVDLSVRGQSRQIYRILIQRVETLFGIFCVNPTVSTNLADRCFEDGFGEAGLFNYRLDARVLDEGKEEMVLSNV